MYQFNTDWEGVFGFNDNAQELTVHFLSKALGSEEEAAEFFAKMSKADDYWADVAPPRFGYRAGTTLVEILPFLKAFGATDEEMKRFSAENLRLLPGALATFRYIRAYMPVSVITTSYSAAAEAIADRLVIPLRDIYCTKVSIDNYEFSATEIRRIKELTKEISAMPMLDWPSEASRSVHLSAEMRGIAERLTQIFWGEQKDPGDKGLMAMGAYRKMLEEVVVIGGPGKAEAVKNRCQKTKSKLGDVMYCGDSITDAEALKAVRENGGVAVSVNGNSYALKAAEFACLTAHTVAISILAATFCQGGRERVVEIVNNWNRPGLEKAGIDGLLLDQLFSAFPDTLPQVEQITEKNLARLTSESESFRKEVRGRAGKLG